MPLKPSSAWDLSCFSRSRRRRSLAASSSSSTLHCAVSLAKTEGNPSQCHCESLNILVITPQAAQTPLRVGQGLRWVSAPSMAVTVAIPLQPLCSFSKESNSRSTPDPWWKGLGAWNRLVCKLWDAQEETASCLWAAALVRGTAK